MIKKQIYRIRVHVVRQLKLLAGRRQSDGFKKIQFVEEFAKEVHKSVPDMNYSDVLIICYGFRSALSQLDKECVNSLLDEGK